MASLSVARRLVAACATALAITVASGYDGPPPPRPAFEHVTELTPDTFVDLVQEVANDTYSGKPSTEYFPLVMFHVSWCNHCKHSLPEFEEAAKTLEEARAAGQLQHLRVPPKFFVFECDSGAVAKQLCEGYTGTNFPTIMLFRDNRAIRFNRPRASHVFAWWATHAARPMVTMLESAQHVREASEQGHIFVLKAEFQEKHVEVWADVALDFLEDYNFYIAQPNSEAGRQIPGAAPVVSIRGPGLDPLPFLGDLTKEKLKAWANFNRFEPVTAFSQWSLGDMLGCNIPVVTFVHSGAADSARAIAQFEDVAKDLRTSAEYIFATVNMSDTDANGYLKRVFRLVSGAPRIFVFNGDSLYWEDPSLVDPEGLTREKLRALMASEEAKQDGSWSALFKEKKKMTTRLAAGSFIGAVAVIAVPTIILSLVWLCVREFLRGDDAADSGTVKKED